MPVFQVEIRDHVGGLIEANTQWWLASTAEKVASRVNGRAIEIKEICRRDMKKIEMEMGGNLQNVVGSFGGSAACKRPRLIALTTPEPLSAAQMLRERAALREAARAAFSIEWGLQFAHCGIEQGVEELKQRFSRLGMDEPAIEADDLKFAILVLIAGHIVEQVEIENRLGIGKRPLPAIDDAAILAMVSQIVSSPDSANEWLETYSDVAHNWLRNESIWAGIRRMARIFMESGTIASDDAEIAYWGDC